MAPEQLVGGGVCSPVGADVYALGVLLFEVLTGRTPVEGDSCVEVIDNLRNHPPRNLRSVDPSLPVDLDTICGRCLAHDASERFPTSGELHEELERFLHNQPLKSRPWTWRDRLRRWLYRPERIAQAGWFAVLYQALALCWTILVLLVDFALGLPENGLTWSVARDLAVIAATGSIPIVMLGLRTTKGGRLAFAMNLALTTLMMVFVGYSSLGPTTVFAEFYPTPHSKVAAYTGLLLGSTIEAALYWLAVPAWRRSRR
ncbi:MAG: hypothetical protein KDA61_07640, partial [Planctomycetales bacterium]|nr:hypothetical protein [Planctomycetales bacterium]